MRITKHDAEEIMHKLSVLADSADLQADYGLTQEQADSLFASLPHNGGEWIIPEYGIEAVRGEIENAAHILRAIAHDSRSNGYVGHGLCADKLANRLDRSAALVLRGAR